MTHILDYHVKKKFCINNSKKNKNKSLYCNTNSKINKINYIKAIISIYHAYTDILGILYR